MSATLEDLAGFMATHKILRLVYVDGKTGDRAEIERHASAFSPPAPDTPEEREDKDRCACGHSISIEHTETGCAFGCSVDLCNETKG